MALHSLDEIFQAIGIIHGAVRPDMPNVQKYGRARLETGVDGRQRVFDEAYLFGLDQIHSHLDQELVGKKC